MTGEESLAIAEKLLAERGSQSDEVFSYDIAMALLDAYTKGLKYQASL